MKFTELAKIHGTYASLLHGFQAIFWPGGPHSPCFAPFRNPVRQALRDTFHPILHCTLSPQQRLRQSC